jgi:nucleotide-binding universal stress UspA family protein
VAAKLAAGTGRALAALSVVEVPLLFALDDEQLEFSSVRFERVRDERHRALSVALNQLRANNPGLSAPVLGVMAGHAPSAIASVAQASRASVIVMGIGSHAPRQRLFSSGAPLATARSASCPVLAVHRRTMGIPGRVVVGMDFSPESIHAAREALTIFGDGTELDLVHVWKRIATPYPVGAFHAADDEYEMDLNDRFARVTSTLKRLRGITVRTHVREGDAATELVSAASEIGSDVIVAGMRGLGALERLVMGSVSTALVRAAECSVLIVPGPNSVERNALTRVMTGASMDAEPDDWPAELLAFSRRNEGRLTRMEIDDRTVGTQRQLSGYVLSGATYDPRDTRVALMFGGGASDAPHVTHTIGSVQSVLIAASGTHDHALCIDSDDCRTVLTFVDQ